MHLHHATRLVSPYDQREKRPSRLAGRHQTERLAIEIGTEQGKDVAKWLVKNHFLAAN